MANSAIQLPAGGGGDIEDLRGGLRTRILKGEFRIWQRGTSFPAPAGAIPADSGFYTCDRWKWQFFGDGGTFDVNSDVVTGSFVPGQTEVPGNPLLYMKWRGSFTGPVSGNEELDMAQQIESARTYAGVKATLSFWAKGDVAGTILVSTRQNLGLGGDISDLPIFVPILLTTSWKKYVVVFDIQSIDGKTLGANDQFLSLRFTSILGASVAALTGSITVNYNELHDGYIHLAQVQLEEGEIVDPVFEEIPNATKVDLVSRYYQRTYRFGTPDGTPNRPGFESFESSGTGGDLSADFTTLMRSLPSILIFNQGTGAPGSAFPPGGGPNTPVIVVSTGERKFVYGFGPAVDDITYYFHWTADSEL